MKFFNSIKENLKDPKKKSLTLLGIYAIFFIFVFVVINTSGTNRSESTISLNPIQNYEDMYSYEYSITFTESNISNTIAGTYYYNNSIFMYNGNKYFYENGLIYIIDNDSYYLYDIQYNVSKLFNKNFYTLFSFMKEESKTSFIDGSVRTNYIIDSNKFYNYYYNSDSFYENSIYISILEKDNYITSISIDLSNLGIDISNITVEYNNINRISSLEFNKDNYTYRE